MVGDENRPAGESPVAREREPPPRRKHARLDFNVRQMETMQDATSKLLSTLTQELAEERAKSEALL